MRRGQRVFRPNSKEDRRTCLPILQTSRDLEDLPFGAIVRTQMLDHAQAAKIQWGPKIKKVTQLCNARFGMVCHRHANTSHGI